MKKVILSAIAVASFAFSNAQTSTSMDNSTAVSNSTRFGIKGGVSLANLSGGYLVNPEPRLGGQAGVFAEFRISDQFSFQPEVLVSLQGAKFESTELDLGGGGLYTRTNSWRLGYINVPLMVKFYPIQKLSIEVGPQVGILVASKNKTEQTITTNGVRQTSSRDIDIKNQINSADLGASVGLSYYFTDNLFASARYTIGLTSIVEAAYIGTGTVGNPNTVVRNNVGALSIGYRF